MNKSIMMFLFILFLLALSPASEGIELIRNNQQDIKVEVKGEVENEGVFILPSYSNISDVLVLAIPTAKADLSCLNLTTILHDKDVVVVPKISEVILVSINSATLEQLVTLPGIGPSLGQRIIDYRNEYGSFQQLEDLMNVKGIGNKLFAKIKDLICL